MIRGYLLLGSDNGSNLLDDVTSPIGEKCTKCGYLLNFDYYNPFFKLKRKVYDYSVCYDTGNIVSLRFKEFCEREGYLNLQFREFEREPGFFLFTVLKSLRFDTANADTQFRNRCSACGNYEEIFGFEPPTLLNGSDELTDGFYRTDILFGFGDKKHPMIIVSPTTAKKLRREKMKGLYYDPVN